MRNESQRNVEPVFNAACERPAGPQRTAYLDGACGADMELRARVDALLAAHEEASGFLDVPAVTSSREGLGSSIGPYKLLQELGEGGMGVVYMAEQESPVRRKVALKVIKLGMFPILSPGNLRAISATRLSLAVEMWRRLSGLRTGTGILDSVLSHPIARPAC